MQRNEGFLILEDGRTFRGRCMGAWHESAGEVVFNTSMTGYQEILTDPSYAEQMIVLTYPLIGNYGISVESTESSRVHAQALLVSESCIAPSHWQSYGALEEYLIANEIPGLAELDTRALTRHLRTQGTMRGLLTQDRSRYDMWQSSLGEHIYSSNIADKVSITKPYRATETGSWKVAVIDYV